MKFRPLHDRVVVRRIESDEKTKGGIIIPDTAKEKPQEGEVVAVGPGVRDEQGQVVALDVNDAGQAVGYGNGATLWMMRFILAMRASKALRSMLGRSSDRICVSSACTSPMSAWNRSSRLSAGISCVTMRFTACVMRSASRKVYRLPPMTSSPMRVRPSTIRV